MKKQLERNPNKKNFMEEKNIKSIFFEFATSNRIYFNGLTLHEIGSEILSESTSDFQMIGSLLIDDRKHRTNIRFRNADNFETFINAIDFDYDSEDVIFTEFFLKSITHQSKFNEVNRSQYDKGTHSKLDIVEYTSNNCYIPTSSNSFKKCIKILTLKDYTKKVKTFIRDEKEQAML